jgi:hypothetical protein
MTNVNQSYMPFSSLITFDDMTTSIIFYIPVFHLKSYIKLIKINDFFNGIGICKHSVIIQYLAFRYYIINLLYNCITENDNPP